MPPYLRVYIASPDDECDFAEHLLFPKIDPAAQTGLTDEMILRSRSGVLPWHPSSP